MAAEALLWDLLDAGLVRIHRRRDRRGDWEPYQWALTEAGEAMVDEGLHPIDLDAWLAIADPPGHAVLQSIRAWLVENGRPTHLATRLVVAVGEMLRAGRVPRSRVVSLVVGGHTKAVRIEEHREVLEAAFGFPLEQVVRLHGRAVYAWGAFSFRMGDTRIDGRWSVPWLALTPETLTRMEDLQVAARRLLTVENLVPFEEVVRAGLPPDMIAVWTGGFPSSLERDFLVRLVGAGMERVDHWGDLDVGGLRILRHLAEVLPCPVEPWRMEPSLLDRLPTRPITDAERAVLQAWCGDPRAPARDLAAALLVRGVKAEQEGWYCSEEG